MPDSVSAFPDAERRFVETFIRADRRDRLAYELAHPKKRYRALDRFCHRAGDLLDPAHIRLQGCGTDRRDALAAFAAAHDVPVTVVSLDPWLDGLTLPFTEAVRRLPAAEDAAILLGAGFAVVQGEPEKGGTPLWLLTEA